MLHGTIDVNFNEIGEWEAVRKHQDPENPANNMYRCQLEYTGTDGYKAIAKDFWVSHRYGDGAVLLAANVLSTGWPLLRRKYMSEDDVTANFLATKIGGRPC